MRCTQRTTGERVPRYRRLACTIAMTARRMGSGRSGQASTSLARSGSRAVIEGTASTVSAGGFTDSRAKEWAKGTSRVCRNGLDLLRLAVSGTRVRFPPPPLPQAVADRQPPAVLLWPTRSDSARDPPLGGIPPNGGLRRFLPAGGTATQRSYKSFGSRKNRKAKLSTPLLEFSRGTRYTVLTDFCLLGKMCESVNECRISSHRSHDA